MSRYSVEIKEQAQHDLKVLSKSEPKAYQKALSLIAELYDHPQTGTGKPEQLHESLCGIFNSDATEEQLIEDYLQEKYNL